MSIRTSLNQIGDRVEKALVLVEPIQISLGPEIRAHMGKGDHRFSRSWAVQVFKDKHQNLEFDTVYYR